MPGPFNRKFVTACSALLAAATAGCGTDQGLATGSATTSSAASAGQTAGASASASSAPISDAAAPPLELPGELLTLDVPARGSLGVNLTTLQPVPDADPSRLDWDIRFVDGYKVVTNSGPSGAGAGGALGPVDSINLIFDSAPAGATSADRSAGVLTSWYNFTQNGVLSRFHIYGVRNGDALYKLQIVEYHALVNETITSGYYHLRYQRIAPGKPGPVQEISSIDATAGGSISPLPNAPGGCLQLESGELSQLTPQQWASSSDWDLCFRRTMVVTNGGFTGPGSVSVADLDALNPDFDEQAARDAESELSRFEAVGVEDLQTLTYREDTAVDSAIGYRWISAPGGQLTDGLWLVQGADASSLFLLLFESVADSTAETPGRVTLRIKSVEPSTASSPHP